MLVNKTNIGGKFLARKDQQGRRTTLFDKKKLKLVKKSANENSIDYNRLFFIFGYEE